MSLAVHALSTLLPVLYAGAWFAYLLIFFRDDAVARRIGPPTLRLAAFVHAAELVLRSTIYGHLPFATVFEALSATALGIVLVYLYVETRIGERATGFFIVALVFLFQTVSSLFIQPVVELSPLLRSPMFGVHVASAILGYAGIAISAVYGLLYLMLYHELKASHFGLIYSRLPSLATLAELNYKAALAGFVSLTVALVVGAVWAARAVGPGWLSDPKFLAGSLTWLILAACVAVRLRPGGLGRRTAYLSLGGFVVMLVSLLAVNLLLSSFHAFG